MTDTAKDMPETRKLVTEEDVQRIFKGTNFGAVSPREIIRDTLLKAAGGYCSGYTAITCCRELGLLVNSKSVDAGKVQRLTKKGQKYLFWAYHEPRYRPQAPAEGEVAEADITLKEAIHSIEYAMKNCGILCVGESIPAMEKYCAQQMGAKLELVLKHVKVLSGDPTSELPRYGITWRGEMNPIAVLMPDGYWTPWHLAATRSSQTGAEGLVKALESDLMDAYKVVLSCDSDRKLLPDHACRECVPHGEMLIDGFKCVKHKALAAHRKQTGEA